jgi:hypothetical protein
MKSKDYSDRQKKDLAYAELIEQYKEIETTADSYAVIKKINRLKTIYKIEMAKVKDSEKSDAGAENIYKPKLWYFHLLTFLYDQDTILPKKLHKMTTTISLPC